MAGLAVNGLILIVNEYNYLSKKEGGAYVTGDVGTEVSPKIYAEAVRRKILPILLTVNSTSAGLLPFVLGGREEVFWHALAIGTIGGLAFSVFVILILSPGIFPAESLNAAIRHRPQSLTPPQKSKTQ